MWGHVLVPGSSILNILNRWQFCCSYPVEMNSLTNQKHQKQNYVKGADRCCWQYQLLKFFCKRRKTCWIHNIHVADGSVWWPVFSLTYTIRRIDGTAPESIQFIHGPLRHFYFPTQDRDIKQLETLTANCHVCLFWLNLMIYLPFTCSNAPFRSTGLLPGSVPELQFESELLTLCSHLWWNLKGEGHGAAWWFGWWLVLKELG